MKQYLLSDVNFISHWFQLYEKYVRIVLRRCAKLGKIQGGLQRASQDDEGLQYFLNFYAIKISLFRVSILSD